MAALPEDLIRTIMEEIKTVAKTESIIGDPITVADTTIIPVSKISIGFGGGSGEGTEKEKGATGGGGGGGGGVKIEPTAFIVIRKDQVSLLATKPGKLETILETIPDLIEKIREAKGKGKKAKEEKEEEGKEGK
ncbi:MAG: GerW family sporulation protein [Candidatus Bipolaricaulia bacterium]